MFTMQGDVLVILSMHRALRKRWRWGVGLIAAIIAALVSIGTIFPEKFLLHPSTDPIDARGARSVLIDAGETRVIEAFVARSFDGDDAPVAYIVEFTGSGSRAEPNATYAAMRWAPHRVEAWTFNYPGFGRSSGPSRLESIAPMALASFDHVARIANGKPIFVCGNSFGSTAALHAASQRRVSGLLIQNPPALREIVMSHGWWNAWLLAIPISLRIPDELQAPLSAKHVHAPAVFITADDDNVVLPKFQRMTIDVYAGPKREVHVKGKGHLESVETFDAPRDIRAFEGARDWIWSARAGLSLHVRKRAEHAG